MGAAKIQAKDLVRTRKNIEKFAGMKMQVQTLQLRLEVGFTEDLVVGDGRWQE